MTYEESEVKEAALTYFNGDELAANVWMTKYALKNKKGEFLEKTPDDMHIRLAKEFSRIENKFAAEGDKTDKLSQEETDLFLKNSNII